MVGKLFKYEAKYYLRHIIPFVIIVLASALFMKILFWLKIMLKIENVVFDIIFGSSQMLFGISIAVCCGAVAFLSVIRFYKNLYGPEGYLSFTLPVTAAQHIWAKLLAALTFNVSVILITLVGFIVATSGAVFVECVKAVGYIVSLIAKEGGFGAIAFIIELLILIFTVTVYQMMLFYSCISLGQTAKKGRVIMAFVYYFIYYVITQIIGTIVVVIISILSALGKMEAISNFIADNIEWVMHAIPIAAILINLGISAIFFMINRSIMIKKLNLE